VFHSIVDRSHTFNIRSLEALHMRLFVSVDLPDDLAEPVADLQAEFTEASGLKFTDPEQAHITMKFLGMLRRVGYPPSSERSPPQSRTPISILSPSATADWGSPEPRVHQRRPGRRQGGRRRTH